MKIETQCLHEGYTPKNGEPRQIPIIQSTTFKYESSDAMGRLFDLEEEGYFGKVYDDQLRKFYESFAAFWCVQYDDKKFSILQKTDIHSHVRLRVNGVVMNTDLWYKLYDVNRNNRIYLPRDRRTYIW